MRRLAQLLAAMLLPASASAAAPAAWTEDTYRVPAPAPSGFDREKAQAAARAHLEALVALDTQNPPGNERLVAAYLEDALRGTPHVETHLLDAGANRANFVARLRAPNPGEKPVLVMAHMDVVGVDPAKWETPPFVATARDGYLYGRGVIDDKGMLAASLVSFLQLARERERLRRDVILLATAAEEGGPDIGVDEVVARHFDLIGDAAFALNEGGRIRVRDGRIVSVNVQTTEKVPYNVSVTATGPSGHGSVPLPNNALAALARAVARVHEWKAPVRLNETTRAYFQRLAAVEPDPAMADAMRRLSDPKAAPAAVDDAAAVLARDPLHNAVLRSGQSLTLLQGGIRVNVIPSQGTAVFNMRVVPGDDPEALVREMNRVGGEPSVRFELTTAPRAGPPASPIDTDLFRAMETAAHAMAPGVTVMPFMSTGATDGAALRAAGIPTYGILPLPLPEEDELRMHGDNERAPLPAIGWAAEYLHRVLAAVAR